MSRIPRCSFIAVVMILVIALSVSPASAEVVGDINMVDQRPNAAEEGVRVDTLESTQSITGGNLNAQQNGNFHVTTGEIVGSTLNAAGAVNITYGSGGSLTFSAIQGSNAQATLTTGDIDNSDVNYLGALNLYTGSSGGQYTAQQAGTLTASTGNITNDSQVNIIGAMNIATPNANSVLNGSNGSNNS